MTEPRPTYRKVSIWRGVQAALIAVRHTEFLLGLLPHKPEGETDWEAVQMQLADARAVLGELANALADEEVEP